MNLEAALKDAMAGFEEDRRKEAWMTEENKTELVSFVRRWMQATGKRSDFSENLVFATLCIQAGCNLAQPGEIPKETIH
jgi:hypothetical protein